LPKPLEKWLVEALSSVSTNNNHYNYTYFIKNSSAEQVDILHKKDSILYPFASAVDKDILSHDIASLIRA